MVPSKYVEAACLSVAIDEQIKIKIIKSYFVCFETEEGNIRWPFQ